MTPEMRIAEDIVDHLYDSEDVTNHIVCAGCPYKECPVDYDFISGSYCPNRYIWRGFSSAIRDAVAKIIGEYYQD